MTRSCPPSLVWIALVFSLPVSVIFADGSLLAQDRGDEINRSFIAFTIPEKDLLPENVAYDPVRDAFYVGSTRKGKIVRVDRRGTVNDFVAPRQGGLWMIIGMKVDGERRHLWVCSSGGGNLEGWNGNDGRPAGVFQFDLDSGRLIDKWVIEVRGEGHFFNDLVVTPAGDVYATHMFEQPAVYVIRAERRRLEIFVQYPDLTYPNGIALGDAGELYVAHREGISVLDPATGERHRLGSPSSTETTGIDGLYYYQGDLIAVRPAAREVRRLELDPAGRTILSSQILEAAHPMFDNPTTGVVVGDTLYYVANSQFGLVEGGELPPAEKLYEVVVLKLPLNDG